MRSGHPLPKSILNAKSGEWHCLKLEDLYDASTPEVRKWMHENVQLWKEKPLRLEGVY